MKITVELPKRKRGHWARTRYGTVVVEVRGNPENPDAGPAAVDFRHHRARVEKGM